VHQSPTPIHQLSSPEEKIALFRSLFRGREDVYPRRFESRKTGKSGYAPACANEWVRGICEKPRIKCAACPNRRFLPVTDEVLDGILRSLSSCRTAIVSTHALSVVRGSRPWGAAAQQAALVVLHWTVHTKASGYTPCMRRALSVALTVASVPFGATTKAAS